MQKYPMIDFLIPVAESRIPKFAMDYLEHGAGRETLLKQNLAVFDQIEIIPRYLRDMSVIDTKKELFGQTYDLPFGIAPVGMGGIIWPGADLHNAKTASAKGIPMVLSAAANATIEEIAGIAGKRLWFQIYSPKDSAIRWDLLERAAAVGVEVLVVTVDVPSPSRRERAVHGGLSLAPEISAHYVLQSILCPIWAMETLRQGFPAFSNFETYLPARTSLSGAADFFAEQVARQVTEDELADIRKRWTGKIVVKGILHGDDAKRAMQLGADGILISNHGGRQNDGSPTALEVLPEIREVVGENTMVALDGGVRSGLDVLRALSLGADFVFLGRPFYYGLAALGANGSQHVVDILRDELIHSMRQTGRKNVEMCSTTN